MFYLIVSELSAHPVSWCRSVVESVKDQVLGKTRAVLLHAAAPISSCPCPSPCPCPCPCPCPSYPCPSCPCPSCPYPYPCPSSCPCHLPPPRAQDPEKRHLPGIQT